MWIRKPARSTVTAINQVSRVAGALAAIFMLAMVALTVADVFLRYLFNAPILGSVELTEYFMVIAGFLGLAWCALKGGHVKVDLIINHLPPRFQAITDSITLILAMTVVPLLAWQGFAQARYTLLHKSASPILDIPAYPFYTAVGLGCALLFLALATVLAEFIRKAIKR